MDPSGGTTIDWYVPSPDGGKIAVSLSRQGSEQGTLHIFDTKSGREIGEKVPRVQNPTAGGSVAWRADGSGFWDTRYPGVERPEADRQFFRSNGGLLMGTALSGAIDQSAGSMAFLFDRLGIR